MSKILLVDDEVDLREEVASWLRLEGHEIFEAGDGIEGVNVALRQQPDLVICDILMPRQDGYGTLLEMQSNPATQSIPFIFVTARASREDVRYGMSLGADDYITKPFSREELLAAIEARLNRKQAADLEQTERISLLADSLDQAREQHQLRSRMVGMFSHDFRNPLAIIMSSNSLLMKFSDKMDDERKELHRQRIDSAARQLVTMLDEMLMIAQSEAGSLTCEPKPTDVVDLLQSAVDEMQFIHSGTHRINFEHHVPCSLELDPRLLRQIAVNLIGNAIKYSPNADQVDVRLWLEDETLTVEVQDFGIGIPEPDLPQLFEAFHRGRNVGHIKGTGLGLPIVKQAIDVHGGTISVQSIEGQGTTFTVSIPASSCIEVLDES